MFEIPSLTLVSDQVLYCLSESGEMLHETFEMDLREYIFMNPIKYNTSLIVLKDKGELISLKYTYIGDLLCIVLDEFCKKCRHTHEKFEIKKKKICLIFAGYNISGEKGSSYETGKDQ